MGHFNDTWDGADRCEAFIADIRDLFKRHRAVIRVDGLDTLESLRAVQVEHDDGVNGWLLDMEDLKRMTDEP